MTRRQLLALVFAPFVAPRELRQQAFSVLTIQLDRPSFRNAAAIQLLREWIREDAGFTPGAGGLYTRRVMPVVHPVTRFANPWQPTARIGRKTDTR